jgi:hypothetical protein
MNPLGVAFKEWAVICRAMAEGKQSLILRKGGIVEPGGEFRVEHDRFWLYPTFVHQMGTGIVEAYRPLLEGVQAEADGRVHLRHVADVVRVVCLTTLEQAHALAGLHGWSEETVTARFHYRTPGLFALVVRVSEATPHAIDETNEYRGCKSWVTLGEPVDAGETRPVLDDAAFAAVMERVGSVSDG